MNRQELEELADRLHKRFGKTYHNPQEALVVLLPIWEQEPEITSALLFSLAAHNQGKKKPHASGIGDSGKLKPVSRNGRSKKDYRIK